jgi:hypothetical protein
MRAARRSCFTRSVNRYVAVMAVTMTLVIGVGFVADAENFSDVNTTNLTSGPGRLLLKGNQTNGGDWVSSVNGIVQDALNPLAFGLKADGRTAFDGTLTRGSTIITSRTANFAPADVGKYVIAIYCGSGGCGVVGGSTVDIDTIAHYANSSTVTLTRGFSGGSSLSHVFFFIATDDSAAIQNTINACGNGNRELMQNCTIFMPNRPTLVTKDLVIERKSMVLSGHGSVSSFLDGLGSTIVWAGSSGGHIIKIRNSFGTTVQNIALIGSSSPANEPDAAIDLVQDRTALTPNSHNYLINISINGLGGLWPDNGNVNGARHIPFRHLSRYGVEWEPATWQDDRNHLVNLSVQSTDICWYQSGNQAVETSIDQSTCSESTMGLLMPNGGSAVLIQPEMLNMGGTEYYVGGGARLHVQAPANENDISLSGSDHRVLVCGRVGCNVAFNGAENMEAGSAKADASDGVLFDLTGVTDVTGGKVWPGADRTVGADTFILPPLSVNPAMMPYKATRGGTTGSVQPRWTSCQKPGSVCGDGSVAWTATDTGRNCTSAQLSFNNIGVVTSVAHGVSAQPVLYAHPCMNNSSAPRVAISLEGTSGVTVANDASFALHVSTGTSADPRFMRAVYERKGISGLASGGVPTFVSRILQGTDQLGWGVDLPGVTVPYGVMTVKNLPPTKALFQVSCPRRGSQHYYVRIASCADSAGTICGLPSAEFGPYRCADTLSSKNYLEAAMFPVKGAASYAVYASTAPHEEKLAYIQPANQQWDPTLQATSFRLSTPSTSWSGYANSSDMTGMVKAATALATEKLPRPLSVAPGAGQCQIFAVAGTAPGTCKLQAICGIRATPVTIVDNVGSGC